MCRWLSDSHSPRQLSKCTDKSALAIHLGEILNETAKFVKTKQHVQESEEFESPQSEPYNNTLKESNRMEGSRPLIEANERKTSPMIIKNRSSEICSPVESQPQAYFGTKSATLLSTVYLFTLRAFLANHELENARGEE